MKRLIAAVLILVASCSNDPGIWAYLNTCLTDSGLTYATIGLPSSGWYAVTYPTAGGHWEKGVWQPHPSQQTTWQYVTAPATLASLHGGGLQVWWLQDYKPGEDDPPFLTHGGTAPAPTAHCVQSAATKGVR